MHTVGHWLIVYQKHFEGIQNLLKNQKGKVQGALALYHFIIIFMAFQTVFIVSLYMYWVHQKLYISFTSTLAIALF